MRNLLPLILSFLLCSTAWAGVDFDNTDDRIIKGDAASLETPSTSITVYALVKYTGGEIYSPAIEKLYNTSTGAPYVSYKISLNEGGANNLSCQFFLGVNLSIVGTAAETLTSGNIYALVGRWTSGEKMSLSIYNLTSGSLTTKESASTVSGSISYSNGGLGLGGSANSDGSSTLNGSIYEAAVWSRKLTDSEVQILGKSQIKYIPMQFATSLVLYIPLDDSSGGTSGDGVTYRDLSQNGNSASGNDGANNTGLTNISEGVLSYP